MEDPYKIVEAIESGKIVKVPEFYAKREGLIILKKPEIQPSPSPSYLEEKQERTKSLTDYMKKKPDWREKQVMSELVENFHWQIRAARRQKGLSRKQLARLANASDEDLQVLESGRLPTNDFILINKVQKALNLNLRNDGKDFTSTTEEILEKAKQKQMQKERIRQLTRRDNESQISGQEIEILDDEI